MEKRTNIPFDGIPVEKSTSELSILSTRFQKAEISFQETDDKYDADVENGEDYDYESDCCDDSIDIYDSVSQRYQSENESYHGDEYFNRINEYNRGNNYNGLKSGEYEEQYYQFKRQFKIQQEESQQQQYQQQQHYQQQPMQPQYMQQHQQQHHQHNQQQHQQQYYVQQYNTNNVQRIVPQIYMRPVRYVQQMPQYYIQRPQQQYSLVYANNPQQAAMVYQQNLSRTSMLPQYIQVRPYITYTNNNNYQSYFTY